MRRSRSKDSERSGPSERIKHKSNHLLSAKCLRAYQLWAQSLERRTRKQLQQQKLTKGIGVSPARAAVVVQESPAWEMSSATDDKILAALTTLSEGMTKIKSSQHERNLRIGARCEHARQGDDYRRAYGLARA